MTHPLERWPAHHRRLALIGVCVATLVITVVGAVTQPLGDRDIVDFELAGSVGEAKEILAGWRAEGVIGDAKAIQLFDLVYPLVYASALAGCCLAAAGAWRRRGRPRAAALGVGHGVAGPGRRRLRLRGERGAGGVAVGRARVAVAPARRRAPRR